MIQRTQLFKLLKTPRKSLTDNILRHIAHLSELKRTPPPQNLQTEQEKYSLLFIYGDFLSTFLKCLEDLNKLTEMTLYTIFTIALFSD